MSSNPWYPYFPILECLFSYSGALILLFWSVYSTILEHLFSYFGACTYIFPVVWPLFSVGDVGLQVDQEGEVEQQQAGNKVFMYRQAGTLQGPTDGHNMFKSVHVPSTRATPGIRIYTYTVYTVLLVPMFMYTINRRHRRVQGSGQSHLFKLLFK